MAGIGKGVGPTIPSPKDVAGTRLDRNNGTRPYVADHYSVYRMGNHMVTRNSIWTEEKLSQFVDHVAQPVITWLVGIPGLIALGQ